MTSSFPYMEPNINSISLPNRSAECERLNLQSISVLCVLAFQDIFPQTHDPYQEGNRAGHKTSRDRFGHKQPPPIKIKRNGGGDTLINLQVAPGTNLIDSHLSHFGANFFSPAVL